MENEIRKAALEKALAVFRSFGEVSFDVGFTVLTTIEKCFPELESPTEIFSEALKIYKAELSNKVQPHQ